MKTIYNSLKILIDKATILGLNTTDINTAQDFLDHHEFGLCLDTLATLLHEYNIAIDIETYDLICKIGEQMNEPASTYSFLTVLLR